MTSDHTLDDLTIKREFANLIRRRFHIVRRICEEADEALVNMFYGEHFGKILKITRGENIGEHYQTMWSNLKDAIDTLESADDIIRLNMEIGEYLSDKGFDAYPLEHSLCEAENMYKTFEKHKQKSYAKEFRNMLDAIYERIKAGSEFQSELETLQSRRADFVTEPKAFRTLTTDVSLAR